MPQVVVPKEEIITWLEWSGRVLLSMKLESPFPKEPSACWPEYAQNFAEAYGYTDETIKAPNPTRSQIKLMDEILEIVQFSENITHRRIIQMRLLVTPVRRKHVYSWKRIAFDFHRSVPMCHYWRDKGLTEIQECLPPSKTSIIRQSYSVHASY